MSVINQMLKDLEQRQQGGEGAVYVPPVRQQGWWMLLLTLICGLALGILGWRTWIYWQQSQRVVEARQLQAAGEPTPDAIARAVPAAVPASVEQEPVDQVVALPTPRHLAAPPAAEPQQAQERAADDADVAAIDEEGPSDEELQPDLYAELAAEQEAPAAAPRKPGVLKIETVNLSEAELATLAERKATTAMAKGQLRDAQDNYYQVLAHDPRNQGAREQLAGLLYGEGRLSEASQLLEEGLRFDPEQADFRLLLARLAISGGDQLKALGWLTGHRPDLASNLDYYATWAGLSQELGQHAEAADLYVKLLRQQPDQGRWWLGLGVAEDGQGHSQRALDAYRNAQLHGNLGEASASWLEQRIAQLAP
ncbi:MAG: MSHA fimbrial biogenesis protein MshN [Aeromonas hydrophila]|uniref:MSHA fimbrial biogenesis protein MshN n=1 Tax=Aeromonas hydrophila TaxID=644 RepID=UPI0029888E45|nr:MSHA fimbrial biogenesis protein MshN [Aeromonas hydrophila]MDX2125666.1 MSHA fimbrial biogenesis protein MshN [Aeromonas hydrophila]HEG4447775.1 MSHA fimbrial biogenesis protein MshN [Aeromonas hydrophila]